MKLITRSLFIILILQAVLVSGCVTRAVWEDGPLSRYREPASDPSVELFYSKQKGDVLVEYDETREGSSKLERRAYWINPNERRLQNRQRPLFVPLKEAQGVDLIPLRTDNSAQPASMGFPKGTLSGVQGTNGTTFTVYSGEQQILIAELPVYQDWTGRTKQILLTPPAVVADVTVVGAVVAWFCLPDLWTTMNGLAR